VHSMPEATHDAKTTDDRVLTFEVTGDPQGSSGSRAPGMAAWERPPALTKE
jgi:hypothetical protein